VISFLIHAQEISAQHFAVITPRDVALATKKGEKMSLKRLASNAFHSLRVALAWVALFQFTLGASLASAAPPQPGSNDANTTTPIKHVIIIIGENRTFDHVFATYVPQPGQHVLNLSPKASSRSTPTRMPFPALIGRSVTSCRPPVPIPSYWPRRPGSFPTTSCPRLSPAVPAARTAIFLAPTPVAPRHRLPRFRHLRAPWCRKTVCPMTTTSI